jgi:phage terminase small subunit
VLQLLRVERDVAAFREVLAVEGRIIAGRSGATVHPAARALHQSETLLLAIRSSLTMTPRMRAQLSVADLPEDESPLDALLQQWRRPATPPQTPEPKTDDDAA